MSLSNPTEQLVEDVAAVYFGAIGATIKRGVEIDDAGERGGATEVVLKGRLGAALHRLNPELPHDTVEEVVRILSRPPHPTLIQNNRWLHALLTDGVEIEYRLPAEASAQAGDVKGPRKNNSVAPRASLGRAGKARCAGKGYSLGKQRNAAGVVQGRPNAGTYFCADPKSGETRVRAAGYLVAAAV